MVAKRIRIVGLLIGLLLLMIWPVAAQESRDIPEVVASMGNGTLTVAPSEIHAGITNLVVENVDSQTQIQGIVGRLNDGVTPDDLLAVVGNQPAVAQLTSVYGGLVVPAESSASLILELKPGTNVFLGFEAEPLFFDVASTDVPTAEAPQADVTMAIVDFAFGTPPTIEAGELLWHIQNVGLSLHQVVIIKVDEGTTLDEASDLVATALTPTGQLVENSPAEVRFVWVISPGENVWTPIDLEPGSYAVGDSLPDFTRLPELHTNLEYGMIRIFTVE